MEVKEVMDKVSAWLTKRGIPYARDDNAEIISGVFEFSDGVSSERFVIDCRAKVSICYAFIKLDSSIQAAKVAELATRINYWLLRGNFDFNPKRIDLRYKYLLLNDAFSGGDEVIEDLVLLPCVMARKYRMCFTALSEGKSVDDAFKLSELKED